MIVHDVQQGTAEWLNVRLGIPTASDFDRIITPKTRKASSSQTKYLCQLLAERLTGAPVSDIEPTDMMLRGQMLEPEAADWYEIATGRNVQKVGFVTDSDQRYGCSPDRLVGDDGLLEIKCPGATNHVAALLELMDDEHFVQVQGQLWVTGRKWCDLLFYHPDLPKRVVRIQRDEEFIGQLSREVLSFVAQLDAAFERLTSGGPEPTAPDVHEPATDGGTEVRVERPVSDIERAYQKKGQPK